MNTLVALPIASAEPVVAPQVAAAQAKSDAALVEAVEGMVAIDRALDQLGRKHGDKAVNRRDYRAMERQRDAHIETLIATAASSSIGLQAKAAAIRHRPMVECWEQHQEIAVSLAEDLLRLGTLTFTVRLGEHHS